MKEKIKEHLDKYDFDIRKSGNGRWIDQKCTMDVISLIADCIIEFVGKDLTKEFTTNDIWYSQYAVDNVQNIFSKPDPLKKSKNEYDKVFGQSLKLLGYSKILNERKDGGKNKYKINNLEILSYIAVRDSNSLEFLCMYIEKVLDDSGLKSSFNEFFEKQTGDAYEDVRNKFFEFTKDNTKITGDFECGRIFTKVINPLAYKKRKYGTIKGRISKEAITREDIQYNRKNWRDINSNKPKNVSRGEYPVTTTDQMTTYKIQKAKKQLRKFNDSFRGSVSEVNINATFPTSATQMHHIFPVAKFPIIADYLENLIALTPNQHYLQAHPNNKTSAINKDYQYLCLVCKTSRIKENLESDTQEHIYFFTDYLFVLNTGFSTEDFSEVAENDYAKILSLIDEKIK